MIIMDKHWWQAISLLIAGIILVMALVQKPLLGMSSATAMILAIIVLFYNAGIEWGWY